MPPQKDDQKGCEALSSQIGLHIFCFKIKDTVVVDVDHMGILIFVVTLVLSSIGHVYMPVEEKFRFIFFHEVDKSLEALVGKVTPVV